MPETRALLLRPVNPFLHRVQVQEGQHIRAGQQRCARGEAGQQRPVHLLDLADVSPVQAAQERAEGGRGADPGKQLVHAAVPQRVQIVDGIGSREHPGHDRADFLRRVHPERAGDSHVPGGEGAQAASLGQAHGWNKARVGDEVLLVEDRMSFCRGVRDLHLRGVLSNG